MNRRGKGNLKWGIQKERGKLKGIGEEMGNMNGMGIEEEMGNMNGMGIGEEMGNMNGVGIEEEMGIQKIRLEKKRIGKGR